MANSAGKKRMSWRALATSPRRRLLLAAIGAVVGMAIALVALLRALPPVANTVPPGYVAMVNGRGVLQSDFIAQVMEYTNEGYEDATPAQRAKVLRDMINEELLVQRAVALDLPETTIEVRSVLVAGVNMQVAQPALGKPATDEVLRAFYNTHKTDFTASGSMALTDLVLRVGGYENANQNSAQAMADAIEAAYQLRSGADQNYVMDHFGLVNSGRTDATDQYDSVVKQRLGQNLYAVARTLEDGQVSAPVVEPDGVHVLLMQKRTPERIAEFEKVRDKVYSAYRDDQRLRIDAENLQLLRREAHIVLAPDQQE